MTDNPYRDVDRNIMGDIYTSTEPIDNLTVLCDDFGSRFGGTRGERQAVDFMKEKMNAYGLKNVREEAIEYIGWRRGEARLEVISPLTLEIPCISLPHSPPADLEATVVDLGVGAPDDFGERRKEIDGKVVLTTSEVYPKGISRWIHRNEKYSRSLLAGAQGFIFVNHYPGYGPATGGIGRNAEAPIPGISVSYEDGAYIQRLIGRFGEVRIRLTSTDRCEPMTSWNVLGELPGKGDGSRVVMAGCHYDGHDISQGAGDPASGAVSLLEAARVLARYCPDLPRTMRFALWGVEEIGLLGSKQYVGTHEEELDRIRFYLNMDSAGAMADKGIVLNEWPELEPIFLEWSREMALDFGIEQSVSAHSDHFPFMMAGVPTGGIGRVGGNKREGRGYGHTRYDTLDKVTLKSLREAAALSSRLLFRIAAFEDWPDHRRSREEVASVLDSPDYREESEFRAEVDAFYAQMNRDKFS